MKKRADFSPEQEKKLQEIVDVFLEENKKINLSAIRDEKGTWEKHVMDSLAAEEILEKGGNEYLRSSCRDADLSRPEKILDFGSGGGFPALPLAVFFPEKKFFPLDSVAKKMRAVQEIAEKCGIKNVEVLTGRGEDLAQAPEYREQFDIVLSRAAAPWAVLLEIAIPFLKKNGIFVSYRGPESEKTDIPLAKKMGLQMEKIEKYELEGGGKRTLWVFTKIKNTPKKFPREVGMPKKKPLTLSSF